MKNLLGVGLGLFKRIKGVGFGEGVGGSLEGIGYWFGGVLFFLLGLCGCCLLVGL